MTNHATPEDLKARLYRLALSFPSIAALKSRREHDPHFLSSLDFIAAATEDDSQLVHAARFVYSLVECPRPSLVGPFDLVRAVEIWDEAHVRAFAAWLQEPFWEESSGRIPRT